MNALRIHSRAPALAGLVLASAAALAVPAAGQETAGEGRLVASHILDWERVGSPAISPDGSAVLYARSHVDRKNDRWVSELWIVDANGGRNRFLTRGSSPVWSPDGTRIAFLADAGDAGAQIFVRWMDAEGATSQITRGGPTPRDLHWSPDSRRIAFTRMVAAPETWDLPSMPAPPEGGQWTKTPRIVRKMHFRQDRVGFLEEGYRHLFVVPADGGAARQLTEGAWHVGSRGAVGLDYGTGMDWTPDGSGLVFDASRAEDADLRYRESHIHFVDLATGAIRQITAERGPWSGPVVSPDGKHIAFSGFDWTDQTYKVSDLLVIGFDGSGMRALSSELDRDIANPIWAPESDRIWFFADDRGSRNLHVATLAGETSPVTEGTHMLTVNTISDTGIAAGVRTSFHEPPEVVVFPVDDPSRTTKLTAVNEDALAGIELGEVEELWYDTPPAAAGGSGARVQGWVIKPPGFDPSRRYPMVLHIHGGPHGMYNVGFNNAFQNFAANGYLLLYTNPRGSTGYGTDFGNAIDNGYPSVDYHDLMAGVDAVVERGFVDESRMYVTGCSGGGVLSSWVIGQTDRFAAAAVRCPVVNWMSFAGTADIVRWGYNRYRGFPWDNPEKYLEHSPLMYVDRVTTPTLLMTGELDLRTPMSQTEEYYQALKALGVPTEMVRFHDEYHGTGSMPSNFIRTQLYMLDWFSRYDRDPARATDQGARR